MPASSRSVHPPAARSGTKRARELATRQFGAIARRQLLAVGLTRSTIAHWLATHRLHPRYPGVYALGRPELGTEGQLAAGLLYAGAGAALAGLSALWWLELLARRPVLIHIDAPGKHSSRDDLRIRHPRQVKRVWRRGLPVVTLPQTLLLAAGSLSHDSLRLVLARAEFKGLLDLTALDTALGGGRDGSSAVRAAMNAHLPQLARCANGLERDFVLLCERLSLPLPEPNPRIGRYRPDMLWREARLIVELDGRAAHHTPAQLAADARRQAELERLGHLVLRFTWDDVHRRPESVAAEVRAHLGRSLGR